MDRDPVEGRTAAMRVDPTPGQASDTAQRLLDAAAVLIDRHGIDRLSTTDVAAGARVSVGTVYRYFEDRDALIRTLYERNVALVRAALVASAATSHGSLEADVRAVLATYVRMHRTLPAYQAVRTWQWLRPEARTDRAEAVADAARELVDVLAPRHRMRLTPARRDAIAGAIRRADALVLAAFLDDPDMDDAATVAVLATAEETLREALAAAMGD